MNFFLYNFLRKYIFIAFKLSEVQTDNTRSQEDILEVSRKLQDAYKDEEGYWHQKSRNTWYSSEDLNTTFYHALTKQRRVRNRIVGLHDADGNWITEDTGVEKVAIDYFENLFSTTFPLEFDSFLAEFTSGITPQMNQRLLRIATEEEVKEALFMMRMITSFFCKAQKEECQTILRILKEYETVSGQLINFEKSSIQFGHKIEESVRHELRDILGIQNLGGMRSYLGLPENMGGSKIQVFSFVQEQLNNRVNWWTFNFSQKKERK